jgi:hypothetical protein
MLETFAWRGSEGAATLAGWRPEQQMRITAREVTRKNPWGGIAGCIYLGRADGSDSPGYFLAGARSAQQRVCATPELVRVATAASGAAALPPPRRRRCAASRARPTRSTIRAGWCRRRCSRCCSRSSRCASRRARSIASTPRARAIRSRVPRARAGLAQPRRRRRRAGRRRLLDRRHDRSRPAGARPEDRRLLHRPARRLPRAAMRRAEDRDQPLGAQLLEGAMVRMAAVAVIDIASGRIEALAGALSPCARQEVDGPGRDAACDTRLPYPVHYRADALLNAAVYHDAMPASTIKPIMATAFLADPSARGSRLLASERAAMQKDGTPARDSLRGQLMRSDSARFLDRMFCFEQGFAACARPWEVQAAARAFGWNGGCADDDASCGKADLLFGGPLGHDDERGSLAPGATAIAYGRLLSEPVGRSSARRCT